jgi:hypothetical protein
MTIVDKLEAALRAEDALILEAQSEITLYLTKVIEGSELIHRLVALFDGPEQRKAQGLACDALAAARHA